MTPATVVLRHELSTVVRNKQLFLPITIFPLLTALLVPLVGAQYRHVAGFLDLYLETAFLPMFLMIPVALPAAISAYSIAGERETRTMESLLATPITTRELLVGKSLGAVVLAQGLTFLAFGAFAALCWRLAIPLDMRLWLPVVLVLSPLLTLFGVVGMTLLSGYARGVREAQQMGVFVMLPMLGILSMAVTQTLHVGAQLPLLAGGFGVLDLGLIWMGGRTFRRERLLGT